MQPVKVGVIEPYNLITDSGPGDYDLHFTHKFKTLNSDCEMKFKYELSIALTVNQDIRL